MRRRKSTTETAPDYISIPCYTNRRGKPKKTEEKKTETKNTENKE